MTRLGLDISTNRIGYAILIDNKIIELGIIKPQGISVIEKALYATEKLDNIINRYTINIVNIEDNLLHFSTGKTSANIIINLAKINAIIHFYMYITVGDIIHSINFSSARKKVFGTVKKNTKSHFKDNKRLVVYFLIKKFGRELYSKLPKNRKGFLSKDSYDICDAIVMALV